LTNQRKATSRKTEERADRILDAAAELVERWGYNKTTIDDIARQAGVAKGTIYLHWKTRDELFWTLLTREDIRMAEKLKQSIANDPAGISLYCLVKHVMLATLESPLAKAMLLMDSQMLGELVRNDATGPTFAERMINMHTFMQYLREQGAIRVDLGIQEQIYILSAIIMGFLMIEQWMPANFTYPNTAIADMAAESVQRALGPQKVEHNGAGVEQQQLLNHTFISYMEKTIDLLKRTEQTEEGFTA
jgi:AcrR family transcriptional regulator